ncbi:DUF6011 domain-containing protein [Kitasatospora atroaurantiaca]|uniref:Uncharacterized protein n=1 Tax=Kitasatospora atroaurantiaca TaxID=285545 RepID=A0A561EN87_9ACTN|nr:hypothetical protein FB465_2088 [Kitasatospora atroaurantiaca]
MTEQPALTRHRANAPTIDERPARGASSAETQEQLAVHVRCRRCRRPLHDPESRLLRLGRYCEHRDAQTRRYDVEQDVLPGL